MKPEPGNVYTDAPLLPRSLFLGSFRLLFWIFFHPSAWRHHLARLDAHLSPDFCLAELNVHQWRRPAFWRLLLMLILPWPLLVGPLIALVLALLGFTTTAVTLGIVLGIAAGLVCQLAAALVGSVVVGTAVGIAIALVGGIAGGYLLAPDGGIAINQSLPILLGAVVGIAGGLAGGLSYGVALGINTIKTEDATATALARQISGIVIGIVLGIGGGLAAAFASGSLLTGLMLGVPFMVAVALRTDSWARGGVSGVLVGLAGSLVATTDPVGVSSSLGLFGIAALLISLFTLPYVLAERIAGSWAGALAGALGSAAGLFFFLAPGESVWPLATFALVGILLGLTLAWWRPVLFYPFLMAWNALLLRWDERRLLAGSRASHFHRHSAFWDELQRLPLVGLDQHLLLVMVQRPAEGELAQRYLAGSRQRWAAQAAQVELDARRLAACVTAVDIADIHTTLSAGELAGPASALLRTASRLSRDVAAALRQESAYNRRLALSAVEDRLDSLLREVTRSNETYAVRFQTVVAQWRQIIAAAVQALANEAELRQEIDSPYIIGVPLTDQQEIFIGRTDISARIEQLLLDRRQPPLLLYGQRRVGKTSLLNNLGRLLPSTIVPLFVDLQGPASRAQDDAGFLYNVARSMTRSARQQRDLRLPPLPREALTADPFTQFEEWLDEVAAALAPNLALLMLDEFEVLATAVDRLHFDVEAVMGMLRHLIQHRPRFKVLLSGSHTLDEFQRWASYLINVQVIHISYLQPQEARQLVEAPVQDFALRYQPAASQRVIDLTNGHPFLVQLLCAEIVALKNEQPPAQRRLANVADVETAVPLALQHGSFFFADIEQNQVDAVGREVLHVLAQVSSEQPVPRQHLVDYFPSLMALEQALVALQQRELIAPLANGYRFQVPLVGAWFEKRP